MPTRLTKALVAASLIVLPLFPAPARADNQMGYRLLSTQEAAGLPHNHGALGMDVDRAQQITDAGLTFDIMRVKLVRPGSPGARAGFKPGDQLIAVDGRVFPTIAAFAAYIGSIPPGGSVTVDFMPQGGGPGQAQRITVQIGGAGTPPPAPSSTGLSTGTKIAIGVGAVALLGCYEAGCFTRHPKPQGTSAMPPQGQAPAGYQQQGIQQQ